MSTPQVMIPSVLPISAGGGRGTGVLVGRRVAGGGVGVSRAWVGVTDAGAVAGVGVPLGVCEAAA
jgi:hypothetical protein